MTKLTFKEYITAINWNNVEDSMDKVTWEKLTEQFWLDTRIPVSNDLDDWRSLSEAERTLVDRVLVGLTMLDTIQSEVGVGALLDDVQTPMETAVLNQIQFMESVNLEHCGHIVVTLY